MGLQKLISVRELIEECVIYFVRHLYELGQILLRCHKMRLKIQSTLSYLRIDIEVELENYYGSSPLPINYTE